MSYTKGEWKVSPRYDWVIDKDNRVIANCTGHANQKDNAYLCAAAPAMYEALKAAQEGTGDWRAVVDLALARADIDERLGNFTEYTTVQDLIDNLHE